jgi:low affinity Fe/Cu permease
MASSRNKIRSNGNARRAPVPRQDWFSAFAQSASSIAGKPVAFLSALALVAIWAVSGPFFGFSETWQLVINTGTTIVTFLMVFLIQSSQNRDTLALQVKLAELILHMPGAPDQIADAEDMSAHQLEALHREYKARAYRKTKKPGKTRARA